MTHPIDIWVDFASQDDAGLPSTLLSVDCRSMRLLSVV